jgi:hypothetical protein
MQINDRVEGFRATETDKSRDDEIYEMRLLGRPSRNRRRVWHSGWRPEDAMRILVNLETLKRNRHAGSEHGARLDLPPARRERLAAMFN